MTFIGKRRNKVEETDEKSEEEDASKTKLKINLGQLLGGNDKDPRIIGLFGSVEEEKAGELCYHLITMSEPDVPEMDEEGNQLPVEKPDDITFYVSTYGGSADDMFSIYDVMNFSKTRCDVVTCGLGKVMSAGVLLLAAGTKGKRQIGRNCRVMIHAVSAGNIGSVHNLVNELDEIQNLQEAYIDAIVENSNFTKRGLKKLMDRKVNVYLSAEEAIEHGIADILI
jgi:ATP-dependent Clp endopeptidase proteolytic subunit ClpP